MNKRILVGAIGALALLLAAIAIAVAQPDANAGANAGGPGGPGGMGGRGGGPRQMAVMVHSAQGVFVLRGGTLTKYDATNLQKLGTLELVERPAAAGDAMPMPPAGGPGAMLVAGDQILVVTGHTFARVDGATLEAKAKGTLPQPAVAPPVAGANGAGRPAGRGPGAMAGGRGGAGAPAGAPGQAPARPRMMGGAPVLDLNGNLLYILRGPELLAVDIETGKVMAQAPAPQADAK